MKTNYYKVAEALFSVTASDDDFEMMKNYVPFAVSDGMASSCVFQLKVSEGEAVSYTEELHQDDEGQEIICGKDDDGCPVFEFVWAHKTAGWLRSQSDYRSAELTVTGSYRKLAIDNALMILFALDGRTGNCALPFLNGIFCR